MTVYITDWSNHNSGGLTQAQADGLVSFWNKCTDGDHWFADVSFKAHCDMARALGVDSLGGYHVLWGNRDLVSQARWFVDRVRAQVPDAKIFMSDNEPFGYNVAPTIAQINAFNDEVARYAGVPAHSVLAYCPQWHYGSAVSGLRYPWVQSNYGSNPPGPYATVYQQTVGDASSRWNGPAPMPFLQYGSRTDVGDANAFRGSAADFFAFIGGTEQPDMTPAQAQQFDDMIWRIDAINAMSPVIRGGSYKGESCQIVVDLLDIQAKVNIVVDALSDGGSAPLAASYTISLSGSVEADNGAIAISGAARPIPPASGQ